MTGDNDDTMRDLVQQAYATEPGPRDVDVAAGLRDVLNRARQTEQPAGQTPALVSGEREWFVALALAEPWLTGPDDDPWPPSNREIYERILAWRGYAWNLERPQRVDDTIRTIARMVFDPQNDPFRASTGRNPRLVLARQIVTSGLVTSEDLAQVKHEATTHPHAEG